MSLLARRMGRPQYMKLGAVVLSQKHSRTKNLHQVCAQELGRQPRAHLSSETVINEDDLVDSCSQGGLTPSASSAIQE